MTDPDSERREWESAWRLKSDFIGYWIPILRSWVNMQTKTFWDNWWSNSETLIPIERCGQFPRQLYTTIALPYVRPWRQRCWPLDMGSMRFPWWALFRKMPKTLGKNTNVSNRSFLGYSLFNLVHHSQTTHKKLHLKYNWKLIFFSLV